MMNGPTMGPGDSMYGGVDPSMYGGSMSASGYPSYTDDYTDPMRSGTSAGQTSPWTSAMQQRFSGSSPYTQNQQQMPPTPGMSGHYGSMYNRLNMVQQRLSPQRPQDKPFFGTPHKQVLNSAISKIELKEASIVNTLIVFLMYLCCGFVGARSTL